ncbi:MAG: VWA domain-containing protein [Burkholderiaceae bacterium]|nr:VWA domain-containing protein [Burkholderiaceae bacterium]
MEEWVGGLWHRFITRQGQHDYPQAAVRLSEVQRSLGIVFRAMGGDAGVSIERAGAHVHGARRRLVERIAGTNERVSVARLDRERFRLPQRIACFPKHEWNRNLYIWLGALAAHYPQNLAGSGAWFYENQTATSKALAQYPGLRAIYDNLVAATLAQRIDPGLLAADEAAQEQALRSALIHPGSVKALPPLRSSRSKPLQPLPLWIYPGQSGRAKASERRHQEAASGKTQESDAERKTAQQTEAVKDKHGMLMFFRAESLLSWADMIRVNRSQDDDPEADAAKATESMESLSVTQDEERVASRVRMDLDLPVAAEDDLPVGPGILLPEWDFRRSEMRQGHCRIQPMQSQAIKPIVLPERLRYHARRLRSQLSTVAPVRRWMRAQPEGAEPDIDAWVSAKADRLAGATRDGGLYLSHRQQDRDLACLVLADLSLSTDASVSQDQKVIDMIRDSLMLFAEALGQTGDRYAIYGFSSIRRHDVRFYELKHFEQPYDALARGRVAAIKPGYYTRLGAAVRHASTILQRQPNRQKLLLILSDGKPHDLDLYEGRYGVEDSKKSIHEAREMGVKPFCVTIDREGADYLPHIFGAQGYALLRKPEELTTRLATLYGQLTVD